jgi:ACS family glucarate transporter-like MFS transporter
MTIPADSASRPTNVRLIIVLLTTLIAVFLYIDRNCLSVVGIYVAQDAGLSPEQLGLLLSCFYWTYAIAQVPSGWLSDGFGPRLVLTLYLVGWSLCTGLMGLVYGFIMLFLLRLGCGLFQAGAYPTAAGLIRYWVPFHRRGLASSIVSIGGRLGGGIMPLLTTFLLIAFVPVSRPSTLTAEDILAGKRKNLAAILSDPAQGLRELLDKSDLDAKEKARLAVVQRFAERFPGDDGAFLRSWRLLRPKEEMPDDLFNQHVLKGLNAVLGQRDLFDTRDAQGAGQDDLPLDELRVESEARRLLDQSSAELTQEEIDRRNRLVLESALPQVIRKIYGTAWRPVVILYGVLGVFLALVFWWYFRNSPREHSGVNAAEIALIQPDATVAASPNAPPPPLPWKQFLTNRSLWLISLVQFFTNIGWAFIVTLFPAYLAKEHQVSVGESGIMSSLPLFIGIPGMFAGGWLTDWMTRKLGVKLGRLLPLCLSRFMVAAAFFLCLLMHAPWPVTIAMAMVAIFTDLGTPATWAFCLDVGGKNTAAVLGWGNMWGNIGAAVCPVLLLWIDARYGYDYVFLTCGLAFVLAGILALGVDATSRVAADEKPAREGERGQ